jgi:hypothetical protein
MENPIVTIDIDDILARVDTPGFINLSNETLGTMYANDYH